MTLTGGEALACCLGPERVPFVFGVAGGKLARFMQGIARAPAIRYIGTRHEATAAHMAAAVYAGTGRIAVAMGEAGPGGAFLASGVAQAFNNNLALLAITSNNQHAGSYPNRGMFMEQDNLSLFRPVTKWNAVVHDGARIPELAHEAFRQALSGRPGPVHLDVPQDVLNGAYDYDPAQLDAEPYSYRPTGRPRGDAALIAGAANLLGAAQRPVLIAGGGVVRSGAAAVFQALAARLGAPVTATQMGLGVAPTDGAGFIGHGGVIGGPVLVEALREADVVLAVGCRFSSWLWDNAGALVRPPQALIHIDIDPAMIGRVAPVTCGIVGDARSVIEDILALLGDRAAPVTAWTEILKAQYAQYRATLDALAADERAPLHPARLARDIGQALPHDSLVCFDGGHTSFWSNDFTPVRMPATCFHDPGLCQLGFGLPYALALKLAHPDRPVFNITGDGAFGFTLAELDTARRHGLNVITIIHNNAAWGVIAQGQKRLDLAIGCALDGTDYAAIARGFGCHGETIDTSEAFEPALARAMAARRPAVLDCHVRFEPHPAMPAFGRMGSYGLKG